MLELRPYQDRIIDETRDYFQRGIKNVAIQLATGGGKTALCSKMLKTASDKGFNSWFIVHRRELIDQTIRTFYDFGIRNFGICAAGYQPAKRMPIQICSIQTLRHRHGQLPNPDFIAFDEFHHLGAKTWRDIYEEYSDAFHIGLSATPKRLDGTGFEDFFQAMVQGPTMRELIDEGFLSDYKLFKPPAINTKNLHTIMGDFVKSELVDLMDRPSITGNAIEHYRKHAKGKRAVVFCVSIKHSEDVVRDFNEAGIPAAHVDGETPPDIRKHTIKRFRNGEIKILSNVELFGEGFDLPALEAAILLRPTMSLGLYLQQIGRALRPSPGKSHAIILDHAGNCERHGLPDEDRDWSLKGINKADGNGSIPSVSIRTCPKCYAAQAPGQPKCQFCGFIFEAKGRKIDEKEGELVEVDPVLLRKQQRRIQGQCETKEDLIAEGIRRGYPRPEAWAHHVWQGRQAKLLREGKILNAANTR